MDTVRCRRYCVTDEILAVEYSGIDILVEKYCGNNEILVDGILWNRGETE